jgi:hypothetical protein
MTQGAIDLVQSELGQKSAKTLRLQAAQRQQVLSSGAPPLTLPATNRTTAPKLLQNQDEMVQVQVLKSNIQTRIAPVLAVQGGRPPDLSELRKTVRQQRANG